MRCESPRASPAATIGSGRVGGAGDPDPQPTTIASPSPRVYRGPCRIVCETIATTRRLRTGHGPLVPLDNVFQPHSWSGITCESCRRGRLREYPAMCIMSDRAWPTLGQAHRVRLPASTRPRSPSVSGVARHPALPRLSLVPRLTRAWRPLNRPGSPRRGRRSWPRGLHDPRPLAIASHGRWPTRSPGRWWRRRAPSHQGLRMHGCPDAPELRKIGR